MIEKIARIEDTFLGIEQDHGILTAWLTLDYGGTVQSVGLYAYDQYIRGKHKYKGSPALAIFVRKVLEVSGVDNWEKLKNKVVFALFEKDEWNGKVLGIKQLPVYGNKQFLFSEQFEEENAKV